MKSFSGMQSECVNWRAIHCREKSWAKDRLGINNANSWIRSKHGPASHSKKSSTKITLEHCSAITFDTAQEEDEEE